MSNNQQLRSTQENGLNPHERVRAEPDEPDVFDSIEDAKAELEHLEAMNDGEVTYEIEEVVDG